MQTASLLVQGAAAEGRQCIDLPGPPGTAGIAAGDLEPPLGHAALQAAVERCQRGNLAAGVP